MKYVLLLCLLFAVTAIAVTATVCAVIGAVTMAQELWRIFRRFCRWCFRTVRKFCRRVVGELRAEVREVEKSGKE